MDDILVDFKSEADTLIQKLLAILTDVELDNRRHKALEDYGQIVDRIMGGAKSLALLRPEYEELRSVAAYAELCKAIGYRGSQIASNNEFTLIVVAFLQDATEMLEKMVSHLGTEADFNLEEELRDRLYDRLQWIAGKFDESYRSSVAIIKNPPQASTAKKEIDTLLAQIGLSDE